MINATEILHSQLARGLGLDKYEKLINGDPSSLCFQKIFNSYYKVRRGDGWREIYYDLFSEAISMKYTFDQIIKELFDKTNNVEPSFSSKMLATIDPSKPVWDQHVLMNLGFKFRSGSDRLEQAIEIYHEIEKWYEDYLNTEEAKNNIRIFDEMLPDYKWISDTKKIDCLLWSI